MKTACFSASIISSKFYVKGDSIEYKKDDIQEKIEKMKPCLPKERYEHPATENQR